MKLHERRNIGVGAGVFVAAWVLPGVSFGDSGSRWTGAFVTMVMFVVLSQLILVAPSFDTRPEGGELLVLPVLFLVGVVQDLLIWLLADWAVDAFGLSLAVDGIGTLVLAALVTRTCMWLLLATGLLGARSTAGA